MRHIVRSFQMRAVANALAALALGTVLSGQVFAQSYGPESDDDAADSRPTYSDRYAPDPDSRSGYRDRQDDYDDQSVRRGPVRRYYRDSETGAWRPLSRRYGYDEPSYREERPAERYRGGARVGEWRQVPPRRSSSSYDRPSYRDDVEERDDRIDESRPSYRRYSEPRERERERDRTPVTSSERSRWTPDRRASRDDSGFKPVPNVTSRHVTTSSIRPAAESTVTISAAEYRELQKQARELRQLRDRPVFPDPPARRSEPESRED
jgi:hypothetical protein